jgi:hypothetical protein
LPFCREVSDIFFRAFFAIAAAARHDTEFAAAAAASLQTYLRAIADTLNIAA